MILGHLDQFAWTKFRCEFEALLGYVFVNPNQFTYSMAWDQAFNRKKLYLKTNLTWTKIKNIINSSELTNNQSNNNLSLHRKKGHHRMTHLKYYSQNSVVILDSNQELESVDENSSFTTEYPVSIFVHFLQASQIFFIHS
jgi:hypothetical protein